jgi:hypothetical protein
MDYTIDHISCATLSVSTKLVYGGYDAWQSEIMANTSITIPADLHVPNKNASFQVCYATSPRFCITSHLWAAIPAVSFDITYQITPYLEPRVPIDPRHSTRFTAPFICYFPWDLQTIASAHALRSTWSRIPIPYEAQSHTSRPIERLANIIIPQQ